MKNKIALLIACLIVSYPLVHATTSYIYTLANETGLAVSKNYPINLSTVTVSGFNAVSASVVIASSTLGNETFNDGVASTGSFTVTSTSTIVAASASDKITIPATSLLTPVAATNYMTVVSTRGMVGQTFTFNGTLFQDSAFLATTSSGTALNFANLLNTGFSGVVSTVTTGGTVIYSTATAAGANGNAFTFFSSSPTAFRAGGLNFAGGRDSVLKNARIIINGRSYRQGYEWIDTGISSTTAISMQVGLLSNALIVSTVPAGTSVIYTTAATQGSAGNLFTLSASTGSSIVISSLVFTGGQDNARVCVNNVCLTQGTDWNVGTTTNATAGNISTAVNAKSTLSPIVIGSTVGNVSTITASKVGAFAAYPLSASGVGVTVSGPAMTGGADTPVNLANSSVFIPNHGYGTGYGVFFTTSSGIGFPPLSFGSGYYIIVLDANHIQFAQPPVSNAIAGSFLTLTSSTTTGSHSFLLSPIATTGSPSMAWQASNDCVNYAPFTSNVYGVAIASTTLLTPYAQATTNWDFGPVGYQCIQAAVVGPTAGGVKMKITINGKN